MASGTPQRRRNKVQSRYGSWRCQSPQEVSGKSNAAAIRLTLCVQLGLRVFPRHETAGNDPLPESWTPCRVHHSHHGGREEGILLPEEESTARIRAALCGLIRRVLGSLRQLGSAHPTPCIRKPRGRGTAAGRSSIGSFCCGYRIECRSTFSVHGFVAIEA